MWWWLRAVAGPLVRVLLRLEVRGRERLPASGPLLFVSGGSDHILPPSVQRENYDKNAKHSTAISAHVVFEGRDHFTCGEPGWKPSRTSPWTGRSIPRPGVLDSVSPVA